MAKSQHNHDGESYGKFVRRQFTKHRAGVWSVRIVACIAVLALFADILASDKPLVASYRGDVMFPVFKQYAVDLGLSTWDPSLATADFRTVKYDWAVFPPVPYNPTSTDKTLTSLQDCAPSGEHWLGTDNIGRDVLAGIIHGSRYALSIGFIAMGIALAIGILLGAIAGYFGGFIDIVISRLIEINITFPRFFLILTIVAMVEQGSVWLVMTIIGLTGWTNIARFMRGEVLRVRNLDYVTAATALGYSSPRIIFRHVMPNAIAPVLIYAAFGVVGTILLESSLSFLGVGLPPTVVTWGSILNKAKASTSSWWLAVFPGLMIFITVCAFNLIGDALRDATDPRLRQ